MTDVYVKDRDSQGGEGLRSLGVVPIPDIDRVTAVAVVPVEAGSGLIVCVQLEDHGSAPEELTYMVIYGAVITRMLPFSASTESFGRELIEPPLFLQRYAAGDREMMRRWVDAAVEGARHRMA